MKRNREFWRAVRQYNDRLFERNLGGKRTVIETSTDNLTHYLGAATIVAAQDCGDYQLTSYETDAEGFCVVTRDGECLIQIIPYTSQASRKRARPQ